MDRKTHTIDADGQVLGRLASKISVLLRGKHKSDFVRYKDTGDFVIVKNVKNIRFTGKKLEKETYYHHSEYMGGEKRIPLKRYFEENPEKVLRKAVMGMMPNNKLKIKQIKRLKIE